MFVFVILSLIIVSYYMYFRSTRRSLYKFCKTIPDVGSFPLLGHTHWFVGGPEKILNNIKVLTERTMASAGGISQVWIGPALYIIVTKPEDIQNILQNCLQKDLSYKFLSDWLGNGLFVAPVDLWKVHRRFLVPIFHKSIVENYIEVFNEQATVLLKRFEDKCGNPEFDVHPYITSCLLDVVFETAMGERMEVQRTPDTPYLRARSTVMSIINMRLFKAWLQPNALFNLTSYAKVQENNINITHQFTNEVVQRKRKLFEKYGHTNSEGRKDLLELMMEKNSRFTNVELREHIDSITIAGNDTTALVISYTLMMLGCHQEEQEKLYQELRGIFGDSKRSPTKEDLYKMDYLERVLKETMRLYTVVPLIARITEKELKLSTCTVPAGVGCAVIPYVTHRSKQVWGPDADEFNPDRFLPENSADRHPCAYIPFSYGMRNCIGRQFGMLAMKSILSNILRTYKITSKECGRLKIEILLFPVTGHFITIEKRNECNFVDRCNFIG